MHTLHFDIHIQAPREQVWRHTLYSPGYEDWTSAFCAGSTYQGSWETGSKIRFLDPTGAGGMVSEIAEHRPAEYVSIRHLGFIRDGVEDTSSEAVRAWAPCYENYSFIDEGGGTHMRVALDLFGDYESYMMDTWPKALDRLKQLCESRT